MLKSSFIKDLGKEKEDETFQENGGTDNNYSSLHLDCSEELESNVSTSEDGTNKGAFAEKETIGDFRANHTHECILIVVEVTEKAVNIPSRLGIKPLGVYCICWILPK